MCAGYLFQTDKQYDVAYDTGDKAIQCGRHVDIFKFWLMWKAKVLTNMVLGGAWSPSKITHFHFGIDSLLLPAVSALMAACGVVLRGRRLNASCALLYIVANCHFFRAVQQKDGRKYWDVFRSLFVSIILMVPSGSGVGHVKDTHLLFFFLTFKRERWDSNGISTSVWNCRHTFTTKSKAEKASRWFLKQRWDHSFNYNINESTGYFFFFFAHGNH